MTPNRTPPVRAKDEPGLGRHLLGLLLVTHPLPSALYVAMTAFLCFVAAAAAHRQLAPLAQATAISALACAQIAVGAFNDYCDRALDAAAGRADKPIVRGDVAPQEAVGLGIGATIVVALTFLSLGPIAFVLGLLIEGLGLAYDVRFKGTPVSAVLFAVYFPLFPLLAWAVFGRWQPFLPWLLPCGALLGIAMNVANTLPDLEADSAAGVRGLPHLLGFRRGLLVAWAAPVAVLAGMLLLALIGLVPAHAAGMIVAAAGALLSMALAYVLYRQRPQPATLRLTFIIQALGVLTLAGGWIAAVAF